MMGNLWQFFGLPDPEGPKQRRNAPNPPPEQPLVETAQLSLEDMKPIGNRSGLPSGWKGGVTPDGEAFHDLAAIDTRNRNHRNNALRYITPDQMHRLPLNMMAQRVGEGDCLIVDLTRMFHMDTHKAACRRQLKSAAEQIGVMVFALDGEDDLLLIPGRGTVVDTSKHELGCTPLLG